MFANAGLTLKQVLYMDDADLLEVREMEGTGWGRGRVVGFGMAALVRGCRGEEYWFHQGKEAHLLVSGCLNIH